MGAAWSLAGSRRRFFFFFGEGDLLLPLVGSKTRAKDYCLITSCTLERPAVFWTRVQNSRAGLFFPSFFVAVVSLLLGGRASALRARPSADLVYSDIEFCFLRLGSAVGGVEERALARVLSKVVGA